MISGPVGVGKTSTGNEISNQLEDQGIPHTFVDLDALTYTFPRSASDPYGNELATENLKAIWANAQKRGSKNLIVPRVCESADYVTSIAQALGIANPILCRLTASDDTLLVRVRKRETGSGLAWHENRALELSAQLAQTPFEDVTVATDNRALTDIAAEIIAQVHWIK